ncbi:RNA dependent RNA polymerase [Red clover powdery mildew-associated totivirus 7]|uniref:RNA-directed RNA polymerase n=1 Tax=Red clover powdery mildew-associated totivirus 7 TaxID=1714368 RepID=A0A0S3Q2C6_9VIRU|nr:RNA dependent RNA polymerase [Red clover powdery mildew-associated totivirus 7]BAT62490.1 RNA dependent RNA polymerase [Red clover powdery mildew-associated totivirus 7]
MSSIPLALSQDSRGLAAGDRKRASWLLFDVITTRRINGPWVFATGAGAVPTFAIYFKTLKLSALYISNKTPLLGQYRDVLMRFSRIQYGPELFPYGTVTERDIMSSLFRVTARSERYDNNAFPLVRQVLKGERQLEHASVSRDHLRHVTPTELYAAYGDELLDSTGVCRMLERLLRIPTSRDGVYESAFVGLLLWARLIPADLRDWVHSSNMWLHSYVDLPDFFTRVKSEYTLKFKALQNNLSVNLTPLFELEVLVNRGMGTMDWESEKANRVAPNLADFSESQVYDVVKRILEESRVAGGRPARIEWDRHWAERWLWAPTGTFHSQYDEDQEFKAGCRTLNSKFYALSRMPDVKYEHFYNRPPTCKARASVKYEWGKQRAIYGVDVTNFIISGFAFKGCEEAISKIYPIGLEAKEEKVAAHVREVLKDGVPFCFDFEDFNSQHSLGSMRAVMLAYKNTFEHDITPEQLRGIDWMIESLRNTQVVSPAGEFSIVDTLMSGSRLTTFMNTVLNDAYVRLLWRGRVTSTLHNGDDVLAAVTTYEQVQQLMAGAIDHNVRFQMSKCHLASVAEFLRVDHMAGTGTQYLARACATLVHGPTDALDPRDPVQQLSAMRVRAEEAIARGAARAEVEKLTTVLRESVERRFNIGFDTRILERVHVSRGGYSEVVDEETLSKEVTKCEVTVNSYGDKAVVDMTKRFPGVDAYARLVTKKYGIEQEYQTIRGNMKSAIGRAAIEGGIGVDVRDVTPDHLAVLAAHKRKAYSHVRLSLKANIARAFGIPILLGAEYGQQYNVLLYGSVDKLKALRAWF